MEHPTRPGNPGGATMRRQQSGVAFMALLIFLAGIGASLAGTATFWHEVQTRNKEIELLFVGEQYRIAIRQYYMGSPGQRVFPPNLAALLRDERTPGIRRYLRRPYLDPLTGKNEWGIIEAPGGGVMGVYSLALGQPIKRANFPAVLGIKGQPVSYADWRFVYLPPSGQAGF